MGIDKDLAVTLFNVIADANILHTAWPNVQYPGDMPYAQVWFMPARTANLGLSSGESRSGILQVNIVIDSGIGMIDAIEYAERFMELIPRGTRLTFGANMVFFDSPPSLGPYIQQEDYMALPVSFEYRTIK